MKFVSPRTHLGLILLGYASVVTISAALIFSRYLLETRNRAEVSAAGGMWAAGDALLGIFMLGLFMVPTIFLILYIARSESFYNIYSQLLLALSLSAPICLMLFVLGENHLSDGVRIFALYRIASAPVFLVGMGVSRFAARSDRAKKLLSTALLIEGLSFIIAIVLFIHSARR